MVGKVIKLLSGVYTVSTEQGPYLCRAKGSFRKLGISPVPGDDVEILALPDHTGRIEEILPRRNYLIRPNVSNVDVLCYVSAVANPTPFPYTIDKMLIIAQLQGITPILVFNKMDLPDDQQVYRLIELYRNLGYEVHCVSAEKEEGLDELRKALENKTVIFAGNTGVGKSSILNLLYPTLTLETGEISEKLGRGRHTTRHIELYPVNGALVGDTPGFGALELEGYDIKREDLENYFVEFKPHLGACMYLDCSHINERDCAIRTAVEKGEIDRVRYENYSQTYQFLKEGETPWKKKTKN
ncbi:MAG: ribosome small subunit-dependent GTPase A [Clostridia bacterium]|nr:ribosome small subunit-dependent GTPase A [Clostridia bacterium]